MRRAIAKGGQVDVIEGQTTIDEALDLRIVHQRDWEYYHDRHCRSREYIKHVYKDMIVGGCVACGLVIESTLKCSYIIEDK